MGETRASLGMINTIMEWRLRRSEKQEQIHPRLDQKLPREGSRPKGLSSGDRLKQHHYMVPTSTLARTGETSQSRSVMVRPAKSSKPSR